MRKQQIADSGFNFQPFSRAQTRILTWWMPDSPHYDCEMVIGDGSIRSGKTVAFCLSFIMWSMSSFRNEAFILAGRTVGTVKRNVLRVLFPMLRSMQIPYAYNRTEGSITINSNVYYVFGASDEASQDKLQGITAAGAYANEAALFPRSFIEQMIGRCSVKGSRIWMDLNPQGPYHYLKTDYIDKAAEKRIFRQHFTMNDNLTLDQSIRDRYERMFTGVWYRRLVKGLWVGAEGAVYDMLDPLIHVTDIAPKCSKYWVAADIGTANPTVFLLVGQTGHQTYSVIKEFRWDSVEMGRQLSDGKQADKLEEFIEGTVVDTIIVDPSAASFITECRTRGLPRVRGANNDVLDGIRRVGQLISSGRLLINSACKGLVTEMTGYSWDVRQQRMGIDAPQKVDDHGPDALRYWVNEIYNDRQLLAY